MNDLAPSLPDHIPNSNPVFGLELRGFDHIPDAERNMTLFDVDQFWVGNNANLFYVSIGAAAITLGLNLWWAFAACVAGNLLYILVAVASIAGVRVGLPTTTLTRAAFGVRGNLPNAFLAWLSSVAFEVINTMFGVLALLALFPLLGWKDPGATGKVVAVTLQLVLGGGVAILGHATMVFVQKVFAYFLAVVLLIVMAITAGQVDWTKAAATHAPLAASTVFATFMVAAGIISSGPISYLYNAPDWVRYLPSRTAAGKIIGHVFWPATIPSVILCMAGAMWATLGDMTDPVAGLKPFIPATLFIVYIAAVVGGSLTNNVATYYSSGLSLQALGLRVHRYVATAIDVCVSTGLVLYILFVQDFSTVLNDFVAVMIAWLGPYAGVWLCDGMLRRWVYDPAAVHAVTERNGAYWGWNGFNLAGWIAMLAGIVACALTLVSPFYKGPLADALGGADVSWLLGFGVSAVVYLGLATALRTERRRFDDALAPSPARD